MISGRILNNLFDLYRVSTTDGIYGNVTETLSNIDGDVQCYITALGGNKPVYAGKLQVIATHRLFCAPLSSMQSNDKVYVDEWDQWFNVLFIDRCSNFKQHWEVLLEEVGQQDIQEDMDSSSSESSESEGNVSSSSSSSSSSSGD